MAASRMGLIQSPDFKRTEDRLREELKVRPSEKNR